MEIQEIRVAANPSEEQTNKWNIVKDVGKLPGVDITENDIHLYQLAIECLKVNTAKASLDHQLHVS